MKTLIGLFVLSLLSTGALAQTATTEGESTVKMEAVTPANKKFEDDTGITDAKLRADSGSLSKYSMKVSLTYYGPIASDLGAKDQPNPDNSVGVYSTSIRSSISGRYRLDSSRAIGVGTGVTGIHPFHGWTRTDVNDPYVSYDVSVKSGGVQMRHSPGFKVITVPNYVKIGEYGSPNYYFSAVYDLGSSHFAVATDANVQYFLYNREYLTKDGNAARYNLSFTPSLKYRFTDKLSLNTSVNYSAWNPRFISGHDTLIERSRTSSLGLGYALKRDIYLNPYINFFPDQLSADRTTLNFSTVFSVL